jgi:hypothetical protein
MTDWRIIAGVVVFFICAMAAAKIQYDQCRDDGYNKTQCWMLIQATGNTTNNNVFGVTK